MPHHTAAPPLGNYNELSARAVASSSVDFTTLINNKNYIFSQQIAPSLWQLWEVHPAHAGFGIQGPVSLPQPTLPKLRNHLRPSPAPATRACAEEHPTTILCCLQVWPMAKSHKLNPKATLQLAQWLTPAAARFLCPHHRFPRTLTAL